MRRLRFLVIASFVFGCSVLTKYDQDGQPCDKNEPSLALSCLSDAGYICVGGFCTRGTGPGSDGGLDAGRDSGFDSGFDAGPADGGLDGGSDGGNLGG